MKTQTAIPFWLCAFMPKTVEAGVTVQVHPRDDVSKRAYILRTIALYGIIKYNIVIFGEVYYVRNSYLPDRADQKDTKNGGLVK